MIHGDLHIPNLTPRERVVTSAPTMMLIHGAWAEGWVWDPVVPLLESAGIRPIAVDLPGTPRSGTRAADASLDSYAAAVSDAIPKDAADVYLVGHSGGGVVATAVAETLFDRVAGVVFVAGIMLPSDVSLASLSEQAAAVGNPLHRGVMPYTIRTRDGSASIVPPEAGVACFFQTAPPDLAIAASRRLVVQPDSGLEITPHWTEQRFGRVRRLYIEALQDRAIALYLQRFMQMKSSGCEVAQLDCDHAPQLSATRELAEILIHFAAKGSQRSASEN